MTLFLTLSLLVFPPIQYASPPHTSSEYYTISLALLYFILIFLYTLFPPSRSKHLKLPPGPKPWPIIGNIHLLGDKPHQEVAKLSKTYGPIMSLKLGSITTIVISSPHLAKEMFLKHDLDFSSRKVPDVARVQDHDKHSMVWLPVGPKWRKLRKIATIQLFTNHQLDSSQSLRQKKVQELIDFAKDCCQKGIPLEIGKAVFTTSLNLLSNTCFSIDFCSHDSSSSREYKDLIRLLVEEGGKPNISDFFPILRFLDLQGATRRTTVHAKKMMGIVADIIDKRLRGLTQPKNDLLGTLLKFVKENELTIDEVKHMFMDLFVAGTDTTASTLEWAMTELIRHPEKMVKAQTEIDQVIGKDELVQESIVSKLPYINAIVKETIRLHAPTPFLVPHKAERDVQLCDYYVPKDAQVWVNVWSIGRDPNIWPNPESFKPERFLEREIDWKGFNFEFMPFGAGRRMCPGMPLANRMVHLLLINLLQSFSWKPCDGVKPEDINMEDKFGLAVQRAQPLEAIPLPR